MKRRGVVLLVGIILSTLWAYADIADTVISLKRVVAKGVKFDSYSTGMKVIRIDSFLLKTNHLNSLADIFSLQTAAIVTSNGPGGLASLKIRGGGSDHTTVVWNGLNIKPPMSGELNYSAINSGTFDNIIIQPGGASTMYGTGAATGVVFLSNSLNLNSHGFQTSINLEGGSFGTYGVRVITGYSGNRFSSRINVSQTICENNFSYKYGTYKKKLEHGSYNSISVSQQNALLLGRKSKIETDLWYVKHFKQVPSLTSDTKPGTSEQTDDNFRFAVNYSQFFSKFTLKYRCGALVDNILYVDYDTVTGFESLNQSQTYINEVETKFNIKSNFKYYLGLNNTIYIAGSDYYTSNATRSQTALFGRIKSFFFDEKLTFSLDARQEVTDLDPIPFVFSFGSNYLFADGFGMKLHTSKLFSLPDLNDLYWAEDAYAKGNPELKPEYGWSTEYGITFSDKKNGYFLDCELTGFYNQMIDAIIWLPDSADGKYTPNNYDGSLTYGIELMGKTGISIDKSDLMLNLGYSYTIARLLDSEKSILSEQRRYIPKHRLNLGMNYSYENFLIGFASTWVGERRIDKTSLPLKPYLLIDLTASYTFSFEKTSINTYIKAKNILNTNYIVLAGYAQPLVSIYGGINFTF